MSARTIFLAAAVMAAGCASSPFDALPDTTVIRWGTSFGECVGYCRTQLEVTSAEATLTRSSWSPLDRPTLLAQSAVDAAQWQRLTDAVEASDIQDLHEVYGCPDCADGGAEWVEVQARGATRRVTFEYGDPPASLGSAVSELRAVAATFDGPQPLRTP